MKKIMLTIGGLILLGLPLYGLTVLAAESNQAKREQKCNVASDPSCRLTSRLEYAMRDAHNEGLNFGDSFGETDPEKVGKNLYLSIYKKAQSDTFSAAIKATAEQYGMPPERMALILGGDISVIVERAPLMRIDQAINVYNSIIRSFNDKKDSLDLEASILTRVEPNEMFADGDLGNSGFDLVNDLNNLEIILFKRNDLVTFGGDLGSGSGGKTPGSTANGLNNAGQPLVGAGQIGVDADGGVAGAAAGANGTATGGQAGPAAAVSNPFEALQEDKSPLLSGGVNPSQCFSTADLDKALEDFSKNIQNNDQLKSNVNTAGTTALNDSSLTGGGGQGAPTNSGGLDVPVPASTTPRQSQPPLAPAPAADYSAPEICDNIICVTLEFISKPVTPSFNSSDNCIHCHVQFINQALQKTISHSLIPAKASGNLGESGLCKQAAATALGSIGMNVSINLVPPITPAKNDLVTLGNITDEWDKYAAQNGAWNYNEQKRRQLEAGKSKKPADLTPIMGDMERVLLVELANSRDDVTQAEILGKSADSYATQKLQEAQEMLVAEIARDAYTEVDTLKVLKDEMLQMNKFFDGFQKQLRTLLEKVPGLSSTQACVKLKEKKACT